MAGHGGTVIVSEQQTETGQTVLTITKSLTKTTNCTHRAKKVEGHDNIVFLRAGYVPRLSDSFRCHSYDRRTLPRSLYHEPTLVSAIGHSQLLDHGCGTAFRPTYTTVRSYPSSVPPGVKDVFVWFNWLTETPAPSDFCF